MHVQCASCMSYSACDRPSTPVDLQVWYPYARFVLCRCDPNEGYAVRPQFASYVKQCTLPWDAVRRALRVVTWWRHGKLAAMYGGGPNPPPDARYMASAWASKTIVAYAPEADYSFPRDDQRQARKSRQRIIV